MLVDLFFHLFLPFLALFILFPVVLGKHPHHLLVKIYNTLVTRIHCAASVFINFRKIDHPTVLSVVRNDDVIAFVIVSFNVI